MKTSRIILASAVICLASCTAELQDNAKLAKYTDPLTPLTFRAEYTDEALTKTYLGQTSGTQELRRTMVCWDETDDIVVYSASNPEGVRYVIDQIDTENPTIATFKISEDGGSLGEGPYYAVYPYSATSTFRADTLTFSMSAVQSYKDGGFASGANAAAAVSTDAATLKFNNINGIVKISLTGEEGESVSSVILENPGVGVTGLTTLSFKDGALASCNTQFKDSTSVTVALPEPLALSSQPAVFYAVVPAGAFEKGAMRMTVRNQEGKSFVKTAVAARVSRSVITEMPLLKCERFAIQTRISLSAQGNTLVRPDSTGVVALAIAEEGVQPSISYSVIPEGAAQLGENGVVKFSSDARGPVQIVAAAQDAVLPGTMIPSSDTAFFYVGGVTCEARVPEFSGSELTLTPTSEYADAELSFRVNGSRYSEGFIVESVSATDDVPCSVSAKIGGRTYTEQFSISGIKPYLCEFTDWDSVPGIESGAVIGFKKHTPAFSPDGKKAYFKSFYPGAVYLISFDLETLKPDWARRIPNLDTSLKTEVTTENYGILVNPSNGWIYVGSDRSDLYAYDREGNLMFDAKYTDEGRKMVPAPREYALAISKDCKWLYIGSNDNACAADNTTMKALKSNWLGILNAETGEEVCIANTAATAYQIFVKEESDSLRYVLTNSRGGKKLTLWKHQIDSVGTHSLTKVSETLDMECVVTKFSYPTAIAPDGSIYDCRAVTNGKMREYVISDGLFKESSESTSKLYAGQIWSVAIGPNAAGASGGIGGDYRVYTAGVFNGAYAAVMADPAHNVAGRLMEVLETGTALEPGVYATSNRSLHYNGLTITEKGSCYVYPYQDQGASSGAAVVTSCPLIEVRTDRNWGYSGTLGLTYNDVRLAGLEMDSELRAVPEGCTGLAGNILIMGTYVNSKSSGFIRVRKTKDARAEGFWSGVGGDKCKTSNWNLVYNK